MSVHEFCYTHTVPLGLNTHITPSRFTLPFIGKRINSYKLAPLVIRITFYVTLMRYPQLMHPPVNRRTGFDEGTL